MTLDSFGRQIMDIMPFIYREMAKRANNDLTQGKISFPQMIALQFASRKPKLTMTELAHALSVKMSSATVLVDRLIRVRWLTRTRDQNDRRLVWVRITPKGRNVINRIMGQKKRGLKAIYGCLTETERDAYLKILIKVKSSIEKKWEETNGR